MLAPPCDEPGLEWLGAPAGSGVRSETRLARGWDGRAPCAATCISQTTAGPGMNWRLGPAVATTRQGQGT
jgi:hypothetical protein